MPQILKHIDKIAREKNRDVIYINFIIDIFSDYETFDERNKLLKWLEDNHIDYTKVFSPASEDSLESYRGQLYLDVIIDEKNEQYKLICAHMDGPENGSFKIPGVESWIYPLKLALQNKHHDEPGFWNEFSL